MTRPRTVGSIVARPERVAELLETVSRIAPQVDALHVRLDGFDLVPQALADHANVTATLSAQDSAPGGRLAFLQHESEGWAFLLDDGLVYPSDYVDTLLRLHAECGAGVGLSVQGAILADSASWQDERNTVYEADRAVDDFLPVNVVDPGSFSFRIGDVPWTAFDHADADPPDLLLSRDFLKQGVPLAVCPRAAGWLRPRRKDPKEEGVPLITPIEVARDWPELSLRYVRLAWRTHLQREKTLAASPAIRDLLDEHRPGALWVPASWSTSSLSLAKILEFSLQWSSQEA